jgi:hypothetical protein
MVAVARLILEVLFVWIFEEVDVQVKPCSELASFTGLRGLR